MQLNWSGKLPMDLPKDEDLRTNYMTVVQRRVLSAL